MAERTRDRSEDIIIGTVVVGASVAGVRVAQGLRRGGYSDPIVVIGDEAELPYDKPPLSKQCLAGPMDPDRLVLLDRNEAERAAIDLRTGVPAAGLDPFGREVLLADGTRLGYDHCVIATGVSARPSPWSPVSGLHLLRSRADSEALAQALGRHRRVVVIGGGFIGAEVASAAASRECDVVVIDPLENPLARAVGEELGRHLSDLHHRHGVQTMFGAGVEAVEGTEGDLTVRMSQGRELRADIAVVGIGTVCNDRWLRDSGLPLEGGVVCDEYCRVVGFDSVYACGDVARWFHNRYEESVRVEHWTNAVEQAACVAQNIVSDRPRAYEPVEYFWSDQYDVRIQVAGRPTRGVTSATVGDAESVPQRAAVLYGDESGSLVGATTLNWPRALVECRRLLTFGTTLKEVERLLAA